MVVNSAPKRKQRDDRSWCARLAWKRKTACVCVCVCACVWMGTGRDAMSAVIKQLNP